MNAPLTAAQAALPAQPWSLRAARTCLAVLASSEIRAANLFNSSACPLEFELCGQPLRLTFEPTDSDKAAPWSFDAGHGAMACAVELDSLAAALPGMDSTAAMSAPVVRAAIAAQLAAGVWAALGLPLPVPELRPRAASRAPDRVCAVRVGFRVDNLLSGARSSGCLSFATTAAAQACAMALAQLATPRPIAAIAIELRFNVGMARLTAAELRRLEVGDIVLHARVPSSGGRWRAVVLAGKGRIEVASGHMKGDSIVTDRVQLGSPPSRAREQRPELLDAVTVEVGFEIGNSTLPLTELLRLAPGHVFELGARPEGEIVNLTVNGASIGSGHLVLVGDALGVRIARLQLDSGVADAAAAEAVPEPAEAG